MDQIVLRNMVFYGKHGVMPEERQLGQRFVVSLELYLDTGPAAQSDDVSDTVNYGEVFDAVRAIVEGPPKHLIETVAESVADYLLRGFPRLHGVEVELAKPQAPIPGAFDSVSVVIRRFRDGSPSDRT